MKNRIKAYIIIITILILSISQAGASEFEINANQSVAEADLTITRRVLSFGFDLLFNNDKYSIGGIALSFRNKQFSEELEFAIGFKGLAGSVERESGDSGLSGMGFMASMTYDLPNLEVYYNMPLDFQILGELCLIPSPLSFGDSDGYIEIKTALGLHVLGDKKGTLLVGYRTLEASFEESSDNWEMSDTAVFFGYKFRF